jgi:putative DNA primase/helicase
MSPHLQKLYDIFGAGVVFLPLPKGSKQPLIKKWQNITFADTQKPDYQKALEHCVERGGNIGVLLGPASEGLISVDWDRDELVDPFIALCPKLASTTRTKGKRGCNFFLRIKPGTPYPNSQSSYALRDSDGEKCGEWRCGGGDKGAQTIIFGVHPDGPIYQVQVENQPVELVFDADLKWFWPFDAPKPTKNGGAAKPGADPSSTQSQNGQTSSTASTAADPQAAYGQALAELGEPFPTTQRGYQINLLFFARLFGINRRAIWDVQSKNYYAYNPLNGAFERLGQEAVAKFITSDILREATSRGFPNVGAKTSLTVVRSIAEYVKSDELAGHKDYFARNPRACPIIHAANGMWQLENDGLITHHEFSPEFRSRNPIPVAYVKDAKTGTKLASLLSGLSDDDRKTLRKYCGLILIGGNRAQKILMLLGKGGTGKGTIVRLLALVLGRNNVAELRIGKIDGRFETYRLLGKLVVTVVEATHDCLEKEGAEIVKALVAHDTMDAEKKYAADPVSFDGVFPIIYVSNEDPVIRLFGDESAWSRRLVPLLFSSERDADSEIIDHYEEVIFETESEAVFAWMVEGAAEHWDELRHNKDFEKTPEQQRRTQGILARSKSVLTFVLDGLKSSILADMTSDEMFDGYVTFCQDKNWHPFPERKFAELVRPLILQHFGVGQSHDIVRPKPNGKNATLRGYRTLELK